MLKQMKYEHSSGKQHPRTAEAGAAFRAGGGSCQMMLGAPLRALPRGVLPNSGFQGAPML